MHIGSKNYYFLMYTINAGQPVPPSTIIIIIQYWVISFPILVACDRALQSLIYGTTMGELYRKRKTEDATTLQPKVVEQQVLGRIYNLWGGHVGSRENGKQKMLQHYNPELLSNKYWED